MSSYSIQDQWYWQAKAYGLDLAYHESGGLDKVD